MDSTTHETTLSYTILYMELHTSLNLKQTVHKKK